ncbi:hypothetical protein PCK1_001349 [Pneumocystis canis]|nr:hypothetical protein PCK1_001349 [Pneumocystis canis]
MTIFQFDLTKFEHINKEEKETILFNTLLEISEKLENLELKLLNEKQTEILQVLFQIIKQGIEIPSRTIRNHLGYCFQIIFSRGDCISLFDTFNNLLKDILSPEIKNYNLYNKWTLLIILKHIYLASGNKLSIHLNDIIVTTFKLFKISNNIYELRASCFEILSVALNYYEYIINKSNTKKIFKFIKSGLSDETDIVKLNALICLKQLLKISVPISGYTDINTIKTITIKFIDESNFSIYTQASKTLAIALISNSQLTTKDHYFLLEKNKETQVNNNPEINMLPTSIRKYTSYNLNSKKPYPIFLKYISDIYSKHITNPYIERFIINIYSEFLEHCEKDWVINHYKFIIKSHIYDLASAINNIKDKQKISTTRNIICHLLNDMKKKLDELSQLKVFEILNDEYLNTWMHKASFTEAKKIVLTSVLCELSKSILTLSYSINTIREPVRNNLLFTLNCTSLTVQKYTSWCIKCFAATIPNDITYLINFCLKYIKEFITTNINNIDYLSKLRIRGHALAVSRLISVGKQNPLYISSNIFSEIFSISYSILKLTANSTIHAVVIPIQVAWTLISSLMKLGFYFVRDYLSQLFLLWENTLLKPSLNNLSIEIDCTKVLFLLYTQEYALGSIFSFLLHNKELLTTNVLKRINIMIDKTNTILTLISKKQKHNTFLDKSVQLSQEMLETMVQKRILQCYLLIVQKNPTNITQNELISRLITNFANPYVSIIKHTSNHQPYSNLQSNLNINGITSFIHLQDFSGHQKIYKTANSNILKNYIYVPKDYTLVNITNDSNFDSQEDNSLQIHDIFSCFDEIPWNQLPIYIEIIDLSILLFGIIFLNQSNKIKESILEQLITFITLSYDIKSFEHQTVVICNSNFAVLGILRFIENQIHQNNNLENTKTLDLIEQIAKHGTNSHNPTTRRISCETIGRLTNLKKKQLVPSSIKFYIKQIIEIDNPNIRSGSALCLGRILNHQGKMAPSLYISQILNILQSLSIDQHLETCFWALESIAIGIQSFGPNISLYCLNILNIISKIYNGIDYITNDVSKTASNLSLKFPILINLVKCLNAVINIFGPDLEKNTEAKKLVSVLIKGLLLERNEEVLTAVIHCTQHVLLFSSNLLNLHLLIKLLQVNMISKHKNLARASIRLIYQLIQHNALNIFHSEHDNLDTYIWLAYDLNPELEELKNIIEIWLRNTPNSHQNYWIQLCLKTFEKKSNNEIIYKINENVDIDSKNEEFSDFRMHKNHESIKIQRKLGNLHWQTQKLILQCINNLLSHIESFFEKSLDFETSQEISPLYSNISNLVKIGFMASTTKNYNIRLEGLKIIQKIIKIFSPLKDPDFPTSSLLEQYEAPLISAIIASFSNDSVPEIAALAIHICSYFLTSGIFKEISKTGKIVNLLLSALLSLKNPEGTISVGDLECSNNNSQIILKLSIISSWAELQIASQNQTCLNSIIEPNLALLAHLWITFLEDYTKFYFEAYELSNDLTYLTSQSVNFNKLFWNIDNSELFEICNKFWINVIYAISILLESDQDIIFKSLAYYKSDSSSTTKLNETNNHRKDSSILFFLLFGICFEALLRSISNVKIINTNKQKLYILFSLEKILNIPINSKIIYCDPIFSELITLLKKLLQTEDPIIQILIIRITKNLINNYLPINSEQSEKSKHYKSCFKNKENKQEYPNQLFELSRIIILPFITYFKCPTNILNNLKIYDERMSKLLIYSLESYIKIIKKFPLITQYDLYDCAFFIILKLYYNKNSCHLIPKLLPLVKTLCEDILEISKTDQKSYEILQNLIENVMEQIIKIIQNSSTIWKYGLLLNTIIMTTTGQILSPKSKSAQKYYNLFIKSPKNDEIKILIHCTKLLLKSSFFSNAQRYIFQSILFTSFNIIKKAHLDPEKSFPFNMATNAYDIVIDLIRNISENNQRYIALIIIIPVLIHFASIETIESIHKKEISLKLLSLMLCYSKNFHQILQEIPEKDSNMLKHLFKFTAYSSMPINLNCKPTISLKKTFID